MIRPRDWNDSEMGVALLGSMLAETCIACNDPHEAAAIADQELTLIERTGQDQWRSMVQWTKGDALLAISVPDAAEVERCYLQAFEVTPLALK